MFTVWQSILAALAIVIACSDAATVPSPSKPSLEDDDIIPVLSERSTYPTDKKRLWDGGVVYFKLDPALEKFRPNVTAAMEIITKVTMSSKKDVCVSFKDADAPGVKAKNYVLITPPKERGKKYCGTPLGNLRIGEQTFEAGEACFSEKQLLHMLMHTLGFEHMHNNWDRDEYLKIHMDQIIEDKRKNFEKVSTQEFTKTKWDPKSIMMLGSLAFSRFGRPVMELKTGGTIKAGGPNLSKLDIVNIKAAYGCAK